MSHILVSHLPCDYQVFWASRDRGIDAVRDDVARFLAGRPWPGHLFRAAILEEADGLTAQAGRGLRNVMDTAPPRARVILTMNTEDGVHPALASRCLRLDLANPPSEERLRVVRRILKLEGIALEPCGLEAAAVSYTDMRHLIIEVERAVLAGTPMLHTGRDEPHVPSTQTPVKTSAAGRQQTGTLRRARRQEREGLIIAELRRGAATEEELRGRLADAGWGVPQPTLYDDLNRLAERGQINSEGYPKSWFVGDLQVVRGVESDARAD